MRDEKRKAKSSISLSFDKMNNEIQHVEYGMMKICETHSTVDIIDYVFSSNTSDLNVTYGLTGIICIERAFILCAPNS